MASQNRKGVVVEPGRNDQDWTNKDNNTPDGDDESELFLIVHERLEIDGVVIKEGEERVRDESLGDDNEMVMEEEQEI